MKDRITWEYKTIKVQDEKLNELGSKGWEVYATEFKDDPTLSKHYLRRPTVNYKALDDLHQNYIWKKEEW